MIGQRFIGWAGAPVLAVVAAVEVSLLVLAAPNVDRLSSTLPIGPEADVNRWTMDGGGVMFSAVGSFELSSTIGQPDAGILVGGEYELNGGFWFPIITGDCNVNGAVDLYDHDQFTDCTTGPGGGTLSPTCKCIDLDQDGDVDLRDWTIFQMEFGR